LIIEFFINLLNEGFGASLVQIGFQILYSYWVSMISITIKLLWIYVSLRKMLFLWCNLTKITF